VTERLDAGEQAAGDDGQVSMYSKEITTPAATGNGSATTSVTDPWVSVLIALRARITLLPSGIVTGETFGTQIASVTVSLSGIATAEAFGVATVAPQADPIEVSVLGIASAEVLGTHILSLGVSASGIASLETHGTQNVALTLIPTGVASAEIHGTQALSLTTAFSGIATGEGHGTQTTALGITLAGIATAEVHGSQSAALDASVAGIETGEIHGVQSLTLTTALAGAGSEEAFGTAVVAPAGGAIELTDIGGIASAETFGDPGVAAVPLVTISDDEIEFWGEWVSIEELIRKLQPEIPPAPQPILISGVGGIPSGEAFGRPIVSIEISARGIPTAACIGRPQIKLDFRAIHEREFLELLRLDVM
jgi:hypothetical protein